MKFLNLKSDVWLTDCVSFPCYQSHKLGTENLEVIRKKENVFITYKLEEGICSMHDDLKTIGFKKINTQVTFSWEPNDLEKNQSFNNELQIKIVDSKNYKEELKKFSSYFVLDRFSVDKRLPNSWSKKIKYNWLLSKEPGTYLLAAKMNEKMAGLILFKMNDSQVVIDLIAVDPQFRGKMVASSLIYFLKKKFDHKIPILVGSQDNNILASNLYLSSGFNEISRHNVYHLFNKS